MTCETKRERQVALRVADLAGDKGDVVPGVRREERTGLRDTERDKHAGARDRADAADRGDVDRLPGVREVGVEYRGKAHRDHRAKQSSATMPSSLATV